MIKKLHLSGLCIIAMLIPTSGWAQNEPADSHAAQPATIGAPATSAPSTPITEPPAPQKIAPATPSPAKPALAPVIPFKPASAPIAPAKPVPTPTFPAIPAPVPVTPSKPVSAPTQSAPVLPAPAQKAPESPANITSQTVDIEVFVREGCLHCDKANEFLTKLKNLKPQLRINTRDVRKEPAALVLLRRMAQNQGGAELDYPAFVVGGHLIIGFTEEAGTAQQILDNLPASRPANQPGGNGTQNCATGNEPSCGLITPATAEKPQSRFVDIFGYSVPLTHIGMPLFTVAMGLLDGLNYGSTWVLILMISLLAPIKDRTLMLAIAGTFIAVQGLIYFILMTVWLNLIMLIDISRISQIAFSSIAIIAGAIFLKNHLYFGHNYSFSSHEIAKPGIYTRIRKIVESETLITALLATIFLATLVQIGEFSYSSAFPALFSHVLTLQKLDTFGNYGYLILYNFAYMLDDLVVLTIGVITFSQERPQEKSGRMLKLISGLVMVGLAVYLMLSRY